MNHYETVFITTPVLSDTQMKEAVGKFKDLITSHGCELIHEENWGLKKLAYPIQKYREGTYVLCQANISPASITGLERSLKLSEDILRHMLIKVDS